MAVLLQVKGEQLDVKKFVAATKLKLHDKWYEMAKIVQATYPDPEELQPTAVMLISKPMQNLKTDMDNTIAYLKKHKNKLETIGDFPGVMRAAVYFLPSPGAIPRGTRFMMLNFPAELLKLTGECNLDLLVMSSHSESTTNAYDHLAKKPRFFA